MNGKVIEIESKEEAKAIATQVNRLAKVGEEIRVTSQETYLSAIDFVKTTQSKINELEKLRKSWVDPIRESIESINGFFKIRVDRLKEIRATLEGRITAWRSERERIERELREKAECEAREKERLEKERLRKEAERKEKEAQAAREKAGEAQRKAEALAREENFEKAERARLEAEERAREAKALEKEAKEIKQESKEVEVEEKEVKTKTKVNGAGFRKNWKFEIININKIPPEFMMPNEKAIGEYVRENKEKAVIPGVRVYSEDSMIINTEK